MIRPSKLFSIVKVFKSHICMSLELDDEQLTNFLSVEAMLLSFLFLEKINL